MNRVAFLGSKEVGYSALDFLIQKSTLLNLEIVAVLSNNRKINASEKSIIQLAENHNLPIFESPDQLFQLESIDYLISVQFHQILSQEHINTAQKLAINLHMAPVPEYRGCNQFSFAIIDGATEFGTTLHVMEQGIDSGDILFENRFPLSSSETVASLHEKTSQASIQLFTTSLPLLLKGKFERTPQSSFKGLRPFGFHLRNEINHIKEIDLNWDNDKIDRHIRATYFPPFPPPYAIQNGKKIELSLNWKKELNR
jgi:methionyl-tRNA formyltransferase